MQPQEGDLENQMVSNPIAIFDSGVGGLSVFKAIRGLLPAENVLYLADQKHVPYGQRSLEEIRSFSEHITRFFLTQGAKLIVVACNTASAAALHYLRRIYPDTLFVGMEPAVKPAAEKTHSGVVGVLATETTFQGELYTSVVERFANGVRVMQDTCPGLVEQIEVGDLSGNNTRQILQNALEPMLAAGIDTVVLGCTHYPLVFPLIKDIVGADVRLIDPSPAIAKQVARLLRENDLSKSKHHVGEVRLFTTGDVQRFKDVLRLIGFEEDPIGIKWGLDIL